MPNCRSCLVSMAIFQSILKQRDSSYYRDPISRIVLSAPHHCNLLYNMPHRMEIIRHQLLMHLNQSISQSNFHVILGKLLLCN